MNKKQPWRIWNLFVATALLAAACSSNGSTDTALDATSPDSGETTSTVTEVPTLSFGMIRSADPALAAVTGQRGWFDEVGVEVEFLSFAEGGGPRIVQAMAGGTPEIAIMGLVTGVLASAQGAADIRVVSVMTEVHSGIHLLSDPAITSVEDLRGKKVSTPPGGGQFYMLTRILEKFDMTLADIEYAPLPIGEAQAAFISGELDAVISSLNGTVFIQDQRPDTRILFARANGDFLKPPGRTDQFNNPVVLVATSSTVETKPEALARFITAYHEKGISYVTNANTTAQATEDIHEYMASLGAGSADLSATQRVVNAIEWYGLDTARSIMTGDEFRDLIQEQLQFFVEQGVIEDPADISDLVHSDIIEGLTPGQ